jgi:RimJ/RimL family protein N-acetyltransferase
MTIELREWRVLDPAHRAQLAQIEISEAQQAFAGTMERAIALCEANQSPISCNYAILVEEQVIGYVVLKRPPMSPDWTPSDAVTLHGFQIDSRMQGRGYGRAALLAAFQQAQSEWPDARRLMLLVDAHNDTALSLYQRCGMRDDGVEYPGRIGPTRRMAISFVDAPAPLAYEPPLPNSTKQATPA